MQRRFSTKADVEGPSTAPRQAWAKVAALHDAHDVPVWQMLALIRLTSVGTDIDFLHPHATDAAAV